MNRSTKDTISIYTDGSCNTAVKTGGWAAIILMEDEKIILTGHQQNTTHQQMELRSVIEALKYLNKNKALSQPITLYTDSQYVAGLPSRKEKLTRDDFVTKKKNTLSNAELIREIFTYYDERPIAIVKVKSHKKNSFEEQLNSEADKLCRKIVRNLVEKNDSR